MREYVIVIPAYRPMLDLPDYIQQFINAEVMRVIVVNDGCSDEYSGFFEVINKLENTTVLTHVENYGKGKALKTAFAYVLEENIPCKGIITADADGQHLAADVLNVGDQLIAGQEDFILGVRSFAKGEVPFRSFVGNRLASKAFELLVDYYLEDTQTGLRGVKHSQLEWLKELSGDRFEYEINMLIQIAHRRLSVKEVQIQTVYHDDHTSNYETIKDSLAIGAQLIKGYAKANDDKL